MRAGSTSRSGRRRSVHVGRSTGVPAPPRPVATQPTLSERGPGEFARMHRASRRRSGVDPSSIQNTLCALPAPALIRRDGEMIRCTSPLDGWRRRRRQVGGEGPRGRRRRAGPHHRGAGPVSPDSGHRRAVPQSRRRHSRTRARHEVIDPLVRPIRPADAPRRGRAPRARRAPRERPVASASRRTRRRGFASPACRA